MIAIPAHLFIATTFEPVLWLVFALLIVIALAFILPPLLQRQEIAKTTQVKEANVAVYRDQMRELEGDLRNGIVSQEQYSHDRDELERRLLDDVSSGDVKRPKKSKASAAGRQLGFALGLGFPILAIVLYLTLPALAIQLDKALGGRKDQSAEAADESPGAGAAPSTNQGGQMTPQQIEANVASLAKKLEQNPGNVEDWKMLARSYSQMQRFKDAAEAYSHATQLVSNDPDLWADYAYVVALVNGKDMQGKPTEFVKKALDLDPKNQKALDLAGRAAFNIKNYQQAIEYWERLLQTLPADSPAAEPFKEQIAEAKRLAKEAPTK